MDCLLAGAPTNFYPFLANATIDGVVLFPYEFGITLATLFSITATHELVVPKSMPIICADDFNTEKKDFNLFTIIIYNYGPD